MAMGIVKPQTFCSVRVALEKLGEAEGMRKVDKGLGGTYHNLGIMLEVEFNRTCSSRASRFSS